MTDFAAASERMVQDQLIRRGISDERVLAAMRRVPRHEFVKPEHLALAYDDQPLPIGEGQTISQPYVVALTLEQLRLRGDEKVLEVGTGSGYQAAVLAELAREVCTIDRVAGLADAARERLCRLGYDRVMVVAGDGTKGLPEQAPFDGIVVAAAAPSLPPPLIEQLSPGGRLVAPVGRRHAQSLIVATKVGEELTQRELCGVVFVPLIGEHGWEGAY
ncbi:MAG: protein-L-isoaspartate(D-aspartate) O-methyltransferase [Armatimonadota bacterium]